MMIETTLETQIEERMIRYWTNVYRDQLGLKDWQARVNHRLEEGQTAETFIKEAEGWFGRPFTHGTNVLVMGGGTGAEFIAFSKRGTQVVAVEPDRAAAEIGSLRAKLLGEPPARFMQGVGEQLPFASNSFDWVWCWSVIEHVQDVEACIAEMVRVTRPQGYIYIGTHDYRQFYEGHYKIYFPMFLPKWCFKLWLRLKGYHSAFFDTLQFVTSRQLTNIFQRLPVTAFYIVRPWTPHQLRQRTLGPRLSRWMTRATSIQRDQFWVVQKQ